MPNAKPNEIDIAGLRELEAKATKGPWDAFMVDGNVCYTSISAHGLTILRVETEPGWPECERSFAGFSEIDDASFIAALRNSALDLLALAEIGQAAEAVREFLKGDPKFDRLVELIDLARKDG